MPPSGDNICKQSSKYHVVNEFLYKALNVEEHESRPNVSLRYSERYYPEDIYLDDRQEQEEDYQQRNDYRRQPVSRMLTSAEKTTTNHFPWYFHSLGPSWFAKSDNTNVSTDATGVSNKRLSLIRWH